MRQVVNPRKYRERVTFFRWNEDQKNALNEPVRVEEAVCNRNAEVKALSGRELWQANQVDERINYRVEMVYDSVSSGMTSKEWMLWRTNGNKRLEIVSAIDVDSEHQLMRFDCMVTE